MRARLHDPNGPFWVRLVLPALGLLCSGVGVYWRVVDGSALGATFFVGIALAIVGPLLVGRHRPRNVTLIASSDALHVRGPGAGSLRQTIRPRDIVGASTSHASGVEAHGQVSLAIALRERAGAPMVLELETETDARAVYAALGIGPRGFGAIGWRTSSSGMRTVDATFRVLGAAWALLLAGHACFADTPPPDALVGILWVSMLYIGAVALALRGQLSRGHGCLTLSASEVRVPFGASSYRVPTATIAAVEPVHDGIRLVREPASLSVFAPVKRVRFARSGMTPLEVSQAVRHIETAMRRAKGEATRELGAADTLGRRSAEANHEWLARLDTAARVIATTAASGYRGSALDERDLWEALEDQHADVNVRAAAARVLSVTAQAGTRARIDVAIADARDEAAAKRIRVAMDPDLEAASRGLDALEAKRR